MPVRRRIKAMGTKAMGTKAVFVLMALLIAAGASADSLGEPGRDSKGANPLKKGETND
jgi:hypothetical protein